MIVLHIADIDDNLASGVNLVVPKHVKYQANYATVGLMTIKPYTSNIVENQFTYSDSFLDNLPSPFNCPDLVVFHECYNIAYIRIYKQLIWKRIPYIIVPHGELNKGAQKKKRIKKIIANILIFNHFINNALAIQCLSKLESDNTCFGRKHIIATNGIEIPSRQKHYNSKNIIRIIYIGRMDLFAKGIDLMLRAIGRICDELRFRNVRVDLYGPDVFGRHETIRQLISELHIEDLVALHKETFGKEKEEVLLSSDIFIQTSRFEGMPMGILEAMSYGVPCLVTNGTSLDVIVSTNKCGWVAETNVESIASAIITAVMEKDKFAFYGENARKTVEMNFQWEKTAKEAIDEYETLLR